MLNINTRIALSRESKRLIKKHGVNNADSWKNINNRVKNDISRKLLLNQRLKCAYCERYLIGLNHQIDHFAHKADYPQFTFITNNLFYSCGFCNSSGMKGQKNTVDILNQRYDLTTFSIVHPYYDNPEIEIIFTDADRIYFDKPSCTQKGLNTINFFKYDKLQMTTIRARDLMLQNLNPLIEEQEMELIRASVAYK